MRNWNKGRWINIVLGIILMSIGSMEKNLIFAFLGFFNLLYVGFYYTEKVMNKGDAEHKK